MENYQSIVQAIESIKRPIKIFSLVGIGIYIAVGLTLVNIASSNKSVEFSTFETCYYGMNSIFNNAPSDELLKKTIIDDVKENKLTFKVDQIHLVKEKNQFECDVFSKDKKGVRRFLVKLDKSSEYKHQFKIVDIKEKKVTSRYQL